MKDESYYSGLLERMSGSGKFEAKNPGSHSLNHEEFELLLNIKRQELLEKKQDLDITELNNKDNKYYIIVDGDIIKYVTAEDNYKILDKDKWVWVSGDNLQSKLNFEDNKAMELLDFRDIFDDEIKKVY